MIVVVCQRCSVAARVLGEDREVHTLVGPASEWWPNNFKCVSCEGPAKGVLESSLDHLDDAAMAPLKWRELTAQELFSSQLGMGLPEERGCDFETVKDLLLNKKITQVKGVTVPNTTRTVLEHVIFEDGTRMYFGAGPQGAVVYRIAKPYTPKEP